MRLLILTQNEKSVLPQYIGKFLSDLPSEVEVVGAVIFPGSPFGKKESAISKVLKVYKIFGLGFFLFYGFQMAKSVLRNKSVKSELTKKNIPILQIEGNINAEENLIKLKALHPDLLISLTANQIFKKKLIELAPHGCLNLHSALLPKNRGLFPTFWALKSGATETGVSVFYVDEGIDSGPILVQKKVPIKHRNLNWLIKECKRVGMVAAVEAIEKILHGKIQTSENNANLATYNSFPKKEDVVDFLKKGNKLY